MAARYCIARFHGAIKSRKSISVRNFIPRTIFNAYCFFSKIANRDDRIPINDKVRRRSNKVWRSCEISVIPAKGICIIHIVIVQTRHSFNNAWPFETKFTESSHLLWDVTSFGGRLPVYSNGNNNGEISTLLIEQSIGTLNICKHERLKNNANVVINILLFASCNEVFWKVRGIGGLLTSAIFLTMTRAQQ